MHKRMSASAQTCAYCHTPIVRALKAKGRMHINAFGEYLEVEFAQVRTNNAALMACAATCWRTCFDVLSTRNVRAVSSPVRSCSAAAQRGVDKAIEDTEAALARRRSAKWRASRDELRERRFDAEVSCVCTWVVLRVRSAKSDTLRNFAAVSVRALLIQSESARRAVRRSWQLVEEGTLLRYDEIPTAV